MLKNPLDLRSETIIDLVDHLIEDAVSKQISDIHIEPFQHQHRVRFRKDGLLYEVTLLPSLIAHQVISRLKVMAQLNIAERRLPQDGHIHYSFHQSVDIRINTCPTRGGEKIVLRLLNASKVKLDIVELGLNENQLRLLINTLSKPQGLILVTGPTGSGKTITLYSILNYLNHIEKNIITIEDPIEIEMEGINQVNINPKIGLDFASALRTFLRQDPDILMIGEIRDNETAAIATQAALTGHLVLATLHTNNASETLARLQSMEIDLYHLERSITLIMAQRLVRKLCDVCEKQGCEQCQQGYTGRVGIFEMLTLNDDETPVSIWEAGMEKVKEGITSFAEIKRVLGYQKC